MRKLKINSVKWEVNVTSNNSKWNWFCCISNWRWNNQGTQPKDLTELARNSTVQLNATYDRREWWQSRLDHVKSSCHVSLNFPSSLSFANSPDKMRFFTKFNSDASRLLMFAISPNRSTIFQFQSIEGKAEEKRKFSRTVVYWLPRDQFPTRRRAARFGWFDQTE
jgi:hypothetical protein